MLRMALQDAIGSFDPLVKLLSLHGMVGVFSRDETGASVIAYEHSIGFDLSIDRSIDQSINRSIDPSQGQTYVVQFLDLQKQLQVMPGEGLRRVRLPLRLRWHDMISTVSTVSIDLSIDQEFGQFYISSLKESRLMTTPFRATGSLSQRPIRGSWPMPATRNLALRAMAIEFTKPLTGMAPTSSRARRPPSPRPPSLTFHSLTSPSPAPDASKSEPGHTVTDPTHLQTSPLTLPALSSRSVLSATCAFLAVKVGFFLAVFHSWTDPWPSPVIHSPGVMKAHDSKLT